MENIQQSANRFFSWLEKVEAKAKRSRIGRLMAKEGYAVSHTGGGCLVWEKNLPNGHYLWVCDLDQGLGEKFREAYLVGCYDADGDFDNNEVADLRAALAWCKERETDPAKFIAAYQAKHS